MKVLSDNILGNHHQEMLGPKQSMSLPVSVPTTSDTYATLTSVMADSYDKQELNNIFDTLLQNGVFPDPSAEVGRRSLSEGYSWRPPSSLD